MVRGRIGIREASPIWVGQLDLANLARNEQRKAVGPAPDGRRYDTGRVLIRFQGEPLGLLQFDLGDGALDVAQILADSHRLFDEDIVRIAGGDWQPHELPKSDSDPELVISRELISQRAGHPPTVSVVIGTRNRPGHVIECVRHVLAQDYPSPVEVIVVDNGATNTATREVIERAYGDNDQVRYIHEERSGLSRARNIGLAAARYQVTAFLSDDIQVDRLWLLSIARGFARHSDVQCVTGTCPPLFLDTPEQLAFESAMAWGTRQGFDPVLHKFDSPDDPIHPYRAGSFANGSNMAYATEVFRQIGGFDQSLGPGTRARGGEDLDAPIRILTDGGLVAFEPGAIGWHADRYDDRPFSQHMYSYGLGLTAFLAKHLSDGRTRRALISRIPKGFPLVLKAFVEPDDSLIGDVPIPLRYHLWQLAGRVAGPFAYLAGRIEDRRTR